MKWISMLLLTTLLTACGSYYNGIDNREVLVSSRLIQPAIPPSDASIDVTDERTNDIRKGATFE